MYILLSTTKPTYVNLFDLIIVQNIKFQSKHQVQEQTVEKNVIDLVTIS